MHFGISTRVFQEYSACEALDRIAQAGFQAAELQMEHLWKADEAPEEIVRHAERLGMELCLHSPCHDVNITSLNPGIRKESLSQVKQSIITGRRLGVTRVVIRSGYPSSPEVYDDVYWRQMEETCALINRWAQRQGIMIGLKGMANLPKHQHTTPKSIRRILTRGWSNIGLTFDVVGARTHMDPVEFLRQVDPEWIVHVHLSDSSSKATHLPLGEGELDLQRILRELDKVYDGLVIVDGAIPHQGRASTSANKAYLQKLGWA
jgi:sugar phosphate isomerase/epimerase